MIFSPLPQGIAVKSDKGGNKAGGMQLAICPSAMLEWIKTAKKKQYSSRLRAYMANPVFTVKISTSEQLAACGN